MPTTYIKLRRKAIKPWKKNIGKLKKITGTDKQIYKKQIFRFEFLKLVSFKFLPAIIYMSALFIKHNYYVYYNF